ncbi:MAG: hypothetical protein K0U45_01225 [Alphaproteobacteria bacterium]|nr:hypothetical protein [Alphaproteobacteria bacterium]
MEKTLIHILAHMLKLSSYLFIGISVFLSGLFYYMAPLWLLLLMLTYIFGMLCKKLVQYLLSYADNV